MQLLKLKLKTVSIFSFTEMVFLYIMAYGVSCSSLRQKLVYRSACNKFFLIHLQANRHF